MIDGIQIADKIMANLKTRKVPFRTLAAVLVGNDSASASFLKQKEKAASSLGIKFKLIRLSNKLSQGKLEKEVKKISDRTSVGGVIVQLPLPKKYNRVGVLNQIPIEKDIDVLNGQTSKVLAPAAGAVAVILKSLKFKVEKKKVAVIGSGLLIGEPNIKLLMKSAKKLTVFNKGGIDKKVLREADLVVSGVGVPALIKGRDLKRRAVVIDFGYGKKWGKLRGDIDFQSASKRSKRITPTPGGTGPIVVAMLLKNFFDLSGEDY